MGRELLLRVVLRRYPKAAGLSDEIVGVVGLNPVLKSAIAISVGRLVFDRRLMIIKVLCRVLRILNTLAIAREGLVTYRTSLELHRDLWLVRVVLPVRIVVKVRRW